MADSLYPKKFSFVQKIRIDRIAWLDGVIFGGDPRLIGALVKKKNNEAVRSCSRGDTKAPWCDAESANHLIHHNSTINSSTSASALTAFVSTMRLAEVAAD